jgi:hypothetical protein
MYLLSAPAGFPSLVTWLPVRYSLHLALPCLTRWASQRSPLAHSLARSTLVLPLTCQPMQPPSHLSHPFARPPVHSLVNTTLHLYTPVGSADRPILLACLPICSPAHLSHSAAGATWSPFPRWPNPPITQSVNLPLVCSMRPSLT